jgi:hypothetical protein
VAKLLLLLLLLRGELVVMMALKILLCLVAEEVWATI